VSHTTSAGFSCTSGDTGAVVLGFENDNLGHLAAQLDRLDNEIDRRCAQLRGHQVTHLVQQVRR
jgi:hypothetical protein